jgi:hypothetical protein
MKKLLFVFIGLILAFAVTGSPVPNAHVVTTDMSEDWPPIWKPFGTIGEPGDG